MASLPAVGEAPTPVAESEQDPANVQLQLYARDLRRVLDREREQGERLEMAHLQLQAFARDLRAAFDAERRRTRELERAHLDTLLRLTRAAQLRDNETGGHLVRIGLYAGMLARHIGLDDEAAERIAAAAPMHDVGKIGIPDGILLKPGPLDPGERKIMERHSAIGASLLKGSGSRLIETARLIALHHHERWDGTGYPQGLVAEAASIEGRITMLVDCYDALRSERPYKPAWSHDEALSAILDGNGRTASAHFDPDLLAALRECERRFEQTFDQHAR
jgi:putative two-component system response regulator